MSVSKKQQGDPGVSCLFMLIAAVICFALSSVQFRLPEAREPTPTAYPYRGDCVGWTNAFSHVGERQCVWGIPTSGETSMAGVWLHFEEENHVHTAFAILAHDIGKFS